MAAEEKNQSQNSNSNQAAAAGSTPAVDGSTARGVAAGGSSSDTAPTVDWVGVECPQCHGQNVAQYGRNRHKPSITYRVCRSCQARFHASQQNHGDLGSYHKNLPRHTRRRR